MLFSETGSLVTASSSGESASRLNSGASTMQTPPEPALHEGERPVDRGARG